MEKTAFLPVMAVFLLLFGCSSPQPEKNYYPLDSAQEIEFKYSMKIVSPQGNNEQVSVLAFKPGALRQSGSIDCKEFSFLFDRQEDHSECYFENKEGVFVIERKFGLQSLSINPPMPLIKKPYVSGTQWEWSGKEGEIESTLSGRIETIEPIEIKGVSYDALRVYSKNERSDGAKIVSTRWYAEGIGPIKEEIEITNSNYPGIKIEIKAEVK
ncbi:MAG: hypothetical protein QXK06_05430 [Candidatus Diapherotrites archaeon]